MMEKLIITDEFVNFYSKPDLNVINTVKFARNEELNILEIEKIKDKYLIYAISENGIKGYTNEIDKIAIILPVILLKLKKATIFQQPNSDSLKIAEVQKNEIFYLLHKAIDTSDPTTIWKKVKIKKGVHGYIKNDCNLIPVNKSEMKRKLNCFYATIILVGLLFISSVISRATGHIEGFPILGIAIISTIFYFLMILISGLFKNKMEKTYYPNIISAYNNDKIA
jgi:hypothetical protein